MKSQELRLKTSYTITSADTDMFARLRPGALVNYLIQSAITSAEQLGFGFNDLKKENLFWVLNRLSIEIYRPLKWNEMAIVETWPKNLERIFYLRDFVIRNQQGDIVAKATSAWLAINIDNKRPKVFKSETSDAFTRLNDLHALDYSPLKLDGTEDGDNSLITPTYFDVDLNRHVTSTRYVDWMMDLYSPEFHEHNYPTKLSVNYLKETMFKQKLNLIHRIESAKSHSFEGLHKDTDKPAFRGKVEF